MQLEMGFILSVSRASFAFARISGSITGGGLMGALRFMPDSTLAHGRFASLRHACVTVIVTMGLGRAVEPQNPAGVERRGAVAALLAGLHHGDSLLAQHRGVYAVSADRAIDGGGGFGHDSFGLLVVFHCPILPSLTWTQQEGKKIGEKCKGIAARARRVTLNGFFTPFNTFP